MLNNGNCETENQAKKPAAFVRRAFQCGNSSPESVALLPAVPRICLAAVVFEPLRAESGIFEDQEAEEELDFLVADEGADGFHGALAARAFERVAAPGFEDEVAPEGAHVAGVLSGWWRFRGSIGFWGSDDAGGNG